MIHRREFLAFGGFFDHFDNLLVSQASWFFNKPDSSSWSSIWFRFVGLCFFHTNLKISRLKRADVLLSSGNRLHIAERMSCERHPARIFINFKTNIANMRLIAQARIEIAKEDNVATPTRG